jgi:hypothetical protein
LPDDYDDLEEEVDVPEGVRYAMLAVEVQRMLTPTLHIQPTEMQGMPGLVVSTSRAWCSRLTISTGEQTHAQVAVWLHV